MVASSFPALGWSFPAVALWLLRSLCLEVVVGCRDWSFFCGCFPRPCLCSVSLTDKLFLLLSKLLLLSWTALQNSCNCLLK